MRGKRKKLNCDLSWFRICMVHTTNSRASYSTIHGKNTTILEIKTCGEDNCGVVLSLLRKDGRCVPLTISFYLHL